LKRLRAKCVIVSAGTVVKRSSTNGSVEAAGEGAADIAKERTGPDGRVKLTTCVVKERECSIGCVAVADALCSRHLSPQLNSRL